MTAATFRCTVLGRYFEMRAVEMLPSLSLTHSNVQTNLLSDLSVSLSVIRHSISHPIVQYTE